MTNQSLSSFEQLILRIAIANAISTVLYEELRRQAEAPRVYVIPKSYDECTKSSLPVAETSTTTD